jgi:hypothetical protein
MPAVDPERTCREPLFDQPVEKASSFTSRVTLIAY